MSKIHIESYVQALAFTKRDSIDVVNAETLIKISRNAHTVSKAIFTLKTSICLNLMLNPNDKFESWASVLVHCLDGIYRVGFEEIPELFILVIGVSEEYYISLVI